MSAPEPQATVAGSFRAAAARRWSFGGDFAWAASLFLAGLGAKLGLILAWGSPFPYMDQWPGEAIETFVPWFTGKFSPATLFAAHNEHRIVFTRLCELGLLRLNGQWDSLLEMAVNAVIQCASIAGFGWVMASLLGKRSWPLIWGLLVLDLAGIFNWENTLWGFQSQFYFLVLFSWLTIWLLALNEPWSLRWWLGAMTGLAALFTVATGFLAAVAVGAITLFAAWRQPPNRWRLLPTWVLCAALTVLGLLLRVKIPEHDQFQAHSAGEFMTAFAKGLAWPWSTWPWYAVIALFPLLLTGWMRLRSRQPPKPAEMMIFSMGLWAGLQALAGAYARGSGGDAPAFRYMDSLCFLAISGALGIFILFTEHRARLRFVPLLAAGVAVWSLSCLAGIGYLTHYVVVTILPDVAAEHAARLKSTRAFLATDDPRVFSAGPDSTRPVPNVEADVWLMRNPIVRGLLPACARIPLRLARGTNAGNAFIPHGWLLNTADDSTETSWGSWSAQQAAARGTFESLPVKASALPYLEIPVAGDLGEPGLSLQLIELKTGRVTEIVPTRPPGGEWVNVEVPAPAGEFKLVARDDSDTKWFAFKEPREMGRLSVWTLRFLAAWKYILVLGLGIFALNLARWCGKPATVPIAVSRSDG